MFQRIIENDIIDALEYQPSVAILGPRQVGKTTLVKQIISHINKPSIYLDLENSQHLAMLQHDRMSFLESKQNELVILDEIQRLPEVFPEIRSLIDQNRIPGRFIFLGSASFVLLKNTSEALTGRVSYFEMTPLLIEEVAAENFKKHWLYGGFPNAYLSKNVLKNRKWYDDFIRSYVERDLPLLGLNASPIQLRRLLTMLAFLQGGIVNLTSISNSLDIKNHLINKYLDFFEQSFLIRRLQPYYAKIEKRLVKAPKVYVRDSGMVHALLGINEYDLLLGHIVSGGSWEGYVIEHVIAHLKFNQLPFYYRTADGAELDLVIEENLKIKLGIEIKLSNSPNIEKRNSISVNDLGNPPLLIITPEATDYQLRSNVFVCSIKTLNQNLDRFLN